MSASSDSALGNEDYSAWLSRTEVLEDVASSSSAQQLAALLDIDLDSDATAGTRLFPLGHWLQFTPTTAQRGLGADGHPKLGGFLPPLPLPRRMWAGSKISFHSPITVGQQLTRTTTIESITPKNGASGKLCFVVLRHNVRAGDAPALTEHQTLVYREAASHVVPGNPPPRGTTKDADAAASDWDWQHPVTPDEVMLFRYSALTFNSHRIHYDLPYAKEIEAYTGLVVHGPLAATFIVNSFLREHPGAHLTEFNFSAQYPVFANEQLQICGRAIGENTDELAVLGATGQPAMKASIEFR